MAQAKVKAIPAGYHTVTPYLTLDRAAEAIEFYKRAFGAEEVYRLPAPGGKIAHAEVRIGDSTVMMADESPEMGNRSPKTLGATTGGLMLYVEQVDQAFDRAVKAGAQVVMPPTDMFWGDRYSQVMDPHGHKWSLATHVRDVSPDEVARANEEFMKQAAQKK